jgi:hypothetical protein
MLVNLQKIPGNQYGIVIADILDQWLMQPSAVPSPTSCQNTKLHYANFPIEYVGAILRAIKDQSAIGWLNMVRGFFAQSWCVLASTYIISSRSSPSFRGDGQLRISRTLRIIHQFIGEVWGARNAVLHDTAKTNMQRCQTVVDSEIANISTTTAGIFQWLITII